jgi:hypothetical protein
MTQHIPFATLADLAERRIPAREQTETLAHLSDCPDCDEQLVQLQRMLDLMRTHEVVDVPSHLDDFALRLFRARFAPKPSVMQQLRAALSFDSLRMAPAFGLRAAPSTGRQLIFSTSDHDLDLCIAASGKCLRLSGQVLGPADRGTVELRGLAGTVRTELNDSMEFSLPDVPAGVYELVLYLSSAQIIIPDLHL